MGLPAGWTPSKFHNFIMSQLRSATLKYPPKHQLLKAHRTRRGFYMCAKCQQEIPASIIENGKRTKNYFVDHIEPVVDPSQGFVSWDLVVERMFNTKHDDPCDGFQVLCKVCHTEKTKKENEERRIARNNKK